MEDKIQFHEPSYFTFRFKLFGGILVGTIGSLLCYFLGFMIGVILVMVLNINDIYTIALVVLFSTIPGGVAIAFLLVPILQWNRVIETHFDKGKKGYVVDLAFDPRRFKGLEGFLESADDLGVLSFRDDQLVFEGDSTYMTIHKDRIESVEFENIGIRVMYVLGKKPVIKFKEPVSGIQGFNAHPRMGWNTIQYWRINRSFIEDIKRFAS